MTTGQEHQNTAGVMQNMTKAKPKIRHCWGYNDGKNAAERGLPYRPSGILRTMYEKHLDSQYQKGYEAGYQDNKPA